MHRWATRVFAFIIAVVVMSCYLVFKFFVWGGKERITLGEFWTDLAWALIDNDYLKREMGKGNKQDKIKTRKSLTEHMLVYVPCYAVRWDGTEWGEGHIKVPTIYV